MNILFVCENYYPHYGGAEILFKNLAEGLVKRGHEVNLVTRKLKGTKKKEIVNGVKIHRVKSCNTRYLFSFTAIPKVIQLAKNTDIIQTTTFNGAPPAWVGAKITKKPVVITILEVWINKWHKVTNFNRLACLIHNLLEKAIYILKFNKYVCISNSTKQDLIKVKVPKGKTTIIYPGVDYSFWDPKKYDRKKTREKLGIENKFVYFSWGRPGISKGFEYVIQAVPEITKRMPTALFLLMLGSKEKYQKRYDYLMQLIKKLNISNQVRIIPSAPYNQLGNYIAATDCVVIPSIAEGFGYTTAEACAMGKPVVASNTTSLPEVISGNYLLVPPKDPLCIAKAIQSIKKGDFTTKPLKKFEWDTAIANYITLYQELIVKNKDKKTQ
jgi:D-inositol-3-phosphate glycosyltransferase